MCEVTISEILKKICDDPKCEKTHNGKTLLVDHVLPIDLLFYFKRYSEILFYPQSIYPIKIVGFTDFHQANPIIVGDTIEDDISNNWYIIGYGNNSQYITIDLSPNRLGWCYDSNWDRHGVPGSNPIIAHSFTELLYNIYKAKGENYYWLMNDFENKGDAYDNIL